MLNRGRQWLAELENGLLPDADKLTVKEWLQTWLEQYAEPNVRIKSYKKYESCLRQYIYPKFGRVTLKKLSDVDLQRHWKSMATEGGVKGLVLSALTVRNTRRYLSMALDQAVKSGYLLRNVAKLTKSPKVPFEEVEVLTEEEARGLIRQAKEAGESAHIIVLLALSSGMRLGELFGLRWSDVDEAGTLHVQRQLVTGIKGKVFGPLKTAKAKRKIPMPKSVAKELRKYRKWQEWQAHLMGDKWEENGLVGTNFLAGRFDPGTLQAKS